MASNIATNLTQSQIVTTVGGNTPATFVTVSGNSQPVMVNALPNLTNALSANTVHSTLPVTQQVIPTLTSSVNATSSLGIGTDTPTTGTIVSSGNAPITAATATTVMPGISPAQVSSSGVSSIATNLQASASSVSVSQNTTTQSTLVSQLKSSTTGASQGSSSGSESHILTRPRLQDLVHEVDPTEQLDEEVEELLLNLADDFVESTVNAACLLAKHRKASTVEVRDVQLYLERNWNMWIPGFGTDELRPYKRAPVTEAHKQRMALIRKALKKY